MLSQFLMLAGAALVAGHGQVMNITVNDQVYEAFNAYVDSKINPPPVRYTRALADQGFVPDFTTPDITCGAGGNNPAAGTIELKAGDEMLFHWSFVNQHPGPVMTYIAHCTDNDCSKFKGDQGNVWVKIDQLSFNYSADPQWPSDFLNTKLGGKWTVTIPPALAPGEYLVRHEILALHMAIQPMGAQFYPNCAQIRVTEGGATELPAGVALPGAYDPNDEEGIHFPEFEVRLGLRNYTAPGGPLWSEAVPNKNRGAYPEM
ncbi:glycoside hydrolase family 61 protein [Daldinia sp. EC12]|nr:glycoside hydrolase family 61 protein [Daldinia sp. EC12]